MTKKKEDDINYRLMRKFRVSVTAESNFTVWGDEAGEVQCEVQDAPWERLLEQADLEVSVTEAPDLPARQVEDGVVTASGWVTADDYKAADGETRLTPTDDPSLMAPPEPGTREFQLIAENHGQIRLFGPQNGENDP